MKTPRTAPKSQSITVSKLAEILGVSRQLISAHRLKPDAPALDDVAGWTQFFAAHGRVGSGNAPADLRRAIAEARLEILRETKRKLARENEVAARQLISSDDAQRQASEAMALVFGELDRIARECPPAMAGLDAVGVHKRLTGEIERMRATLREKFEEIGK